MGKAEIVSHVFPASLFSGNQHPHRATYKRVGDEWKCIAYEELPAPDFIPFKALRNIAAYHAWQLDYAETLQ